MHFQRAYLDGDTKRTSDSWSVFQGYSKSWSSIYAAYLPHPHFSWAKLCLTNLVTILTAGKKRTGISTEAVYKTCLIGQALHTKGKRLRYLPLLSLESQCELTDYIMIYKLCHNMIGITLENVGLSLSTNNSRGCGLRLKQQNNGTVISASRFKFRALSAWNSQLSMLWHS